MNFKCLLHRSLKRREEPVCSRWRASGSAAVTAVCLVLWTAASSQYQAPATPHQTPAEDARTLAKAQSITIPRLEFREATPRECVEYLKTRSVNLDTAESDPSRKGINIVLIRPQDESTEPPKVTLSLVNISILEAARETAALSGLTVAAERSALVLRPGAAPSRAAVAPEAEAMRNRAEQIVVPKLEFREATVAEAADFLRRRARELDPAEPALKITALPGLEETRVTFSLMNAPLTDVLRYVAEIAGCDLEFAPAHIALRPRPGATSPRLPKAVSPAPTIPGLEPLPRVPST